tara:strand:+ start:1692 stop:2453 length:762 start_codon:yes stop_codon:yes gene_type:complete
MKNNISVIIPVFNGEKYLERTLFSIFNQSLKVNEVLIINDGSNDNSKKIIFSWKKKLPIIYYENDKNMGVPFSLRRGICLSKCDIIFRLDSDDEWKKNHVKNIMMLINKHKNSVLFASRAYYKFPKNKKVFKSKLLANETIRKDLMWDNPIVHSSVAFRKEDYLRTPGYSNFYCAHDYALFIELLNIGQFSFSSKLSVNYYVNDNSLSRRNNKKCLYERFMNQWRALFLFNSESKLFAMKVFLILIIRTIFSK